jgi:hypothetical protein
MTLAQQIKALTDQVKTASALVGLLLALITLFTAEQARRLADERNQIGGGRPKQLRTIRLMSIALAVVTTVTVIALWPVVHDVLDAHDTKKWQSVFAVFLLTWVLLIALIGWQIGLAWNAHQKDGDA